MPSLKSYLTQDGVKDDPEPRARKTPVRKGAKAEAGRAKSDNIVKNPVELPPVLTTKDLRERTRTRTNRSRKPPMLLKEKMAERALIPTNGTLLAVEEMDREIARFEQIMEVLYPWDEKGEKINGKSVQAFYWASEMRRDYLALRAPYQTPKLSAIALMQNGQQAGEKRITEVNVTILNERGDREYSDDSEDLTTIDGEISSESSEEAA